MVGLFSSGMAELAKTAKSAKVMYMENQLWYENFFCRKLFQIYDFLLVFDMYDGSIFMWYG